MATFIDTSAIYAILNAGDNNHGQAEEVWRALRQKNEQMVTTSYVLSESVALLQSRIGFAAVRAFQSLVAPVPSVLWVDETLHQHGIASLLTAGRRDLSLVDCVSFAAMRQLDVDVAFAFDDHFVEQGFRLLR